MSVILAPGRLRQEDCHDFKAILGYRVKSVSNQPSNQPTNQQTKIPITFSAFEGGLWASGKGTEVGVGIRVASNPSSSEVCMSLFRYFSLSLNSKGIP